MERRFGADFSDVRVHTNNDTADLSRSLNAKAFTYGRDIAFNRGEFSPDTKEGKTLLAHELAHTIQQGAVGRKVMREAWHPSKTLEEVGEDRVKETFIQKANRIARIAQRNNEIVDCADVALQAIVETARELGLPLKLRPDRRETYDSNNFRNYESFVRHVKAYLGSIHLFDRNLNTRRKSIDDLERGDLIMYDLQKHNDTRYKGHTMIVTSVTRDPQTHRLISVTATEGHISGPPDMGTTYTREELLNRWPQTENAEAQPREWNFEAIFG